MRTKSAHTPGTFCWWELATTDLDAAYAFYRGLFGWGKSDLPMGPGQVYRMLDLDGNGVGAMYQLDAAQRERGVPSGWLAYVSVVNADESARRIAAAGGTLASQPFDVMDSGRMAVFTDPGGARAAIWQPGRHFGAAVVNEPGSACWMELAARDAAAMRRFYASAFGWSPLVRQMPGPGEYTEWGVAGEAQTFGGMLQMNEQWGDMAPHWMTYFKVDDCDVIAARVKVGGGKMMVGPFDAPGVGRLGVVRDPTGGICSIIRLSMPGR
jgi:uncharacterized protein